MQIDLTPVLQTCYVFIKNTASCPQIRCDRESNELTHIESYHGLEVLRLQPFFLHHETAINASLNVQQCIQPW